MYFCSWQSRASHHQYIPAFYRFFGNYSTKILSRLDDFLNRTNPDFFANNRVKQSLQLMFNLES